MDIVTLGLVIGMANALLAAGIVLIYMSNRVINLAHGEFGAFAVSMMITLTGWAHWNYWAALAVSLASAAVLGAMVERWVLRRLFNSPRLILLIATIGAAQLIIVARLILPKPTVSKGVKLLAGGGTIFPVPLHTHPVVFGRVVLFPAHFMVLIIGPLLALALFAFLRWSAYGIALRAAAENAPRARLLGIPVRRVSTLAWVLAALLSAAGAILLAPIIGFSSTEAVGLPLLMRGLAAATITGFESVGAAFGAGLALGVVDQLVYFWTGRSGLTDLVLLIVVVGSLLWRKQGFVRTIAADLSSWEGADVSRPLPIQILSHPRWRSFSRACMAGAVAVLVILPFVLRSSGVFFLSSIALIAAVAVSLTILTGWAGQLSIGQWALAGVGGVYGAKLAGDMHLEFWLAFMAATAIGGAFALVMGLPALRLEGMTLAVVTLAFAVAAEEWLFQQGWFRVSGPVARPSYLTTDGLYVTSVVFLAAVMLMARSLQRSRVGRNMVAVRDNPAQAASFGISVVRTKLAAFVISGVVAAAAGYLWVVGIGSADSSIFPASRSLSVLAAVVIGGLGSAAGAVLGTFYFWAVPYFGAGLTPYIGLLATGVGLLALLLFLPGGLARPFLLARDRLAGLLTGIDPRRLSEGESAGPAVGSGGTPERADPGGQEGTDDPPAAVSAARVLAGAAR